MKAMMHFTAASAMNGSSLNAYIPIAAFVLEGQRNH